MGIKEIPPSLLKPKPTNLSLQLSLHILKKKKEEKWWKKLTPKITLGLTC